MIKDPEECMTMAEVRAGVDKVDEALISLLARRFGYMAAAHILRGILRIVREKGRSILKLDQ